MNPFNLLADRLPAQVRLWVYIVAALLLFGYGLWQAAQGDWLQFAVSVVTALVSGMAGGNVNTEPVALDESEYEGE